MTRQRKVFAGLILLAMIVFLDSSLSQTRRSSMRRRPIRGQRPRRMTDAQLQEQINRAMAQAYGQALKEALAPTAAQWRMIEPKLKKVRELSDQAEVAVKIKNAKLITTTETLRGDRAEAAGGKPSEPQSTTTHDRDEWRDSLHRESKARLLGAEKVCAELVSLIESGGATDEQKKAKMNALRQAKQKAAEELAVAQDELRKVLSLRQQTTLFLIGLLN